MKTLQLLAFTLLLASTLFLAITQQGEADSNRPSINANGMVQTVYFLPNDRPARSDRIAALRQLVKDAQQFFADEMNRHGFGRKTFTFETDSDGEPLVHRINGKFRQEYYYSENLTDYTVWAELLEHFDGADLQHVYLVAIDLSYQALNGGEAGGLGGAIFYPAYRDIGFGPAGGAKLRHRDITPGEELLGGFALIPAHGHNFERLGLTIHELGHGLGIEHDFREGIHSDYVMGFGKQNRLSKCAAEWLSVSRFFNTKKNFHNEPGEIQFLSRRTYNQDTISFRFKVTDPDGLHQAQLLVPEILNGTGWGANRLFDCKRLNGTTGTVESVLRTAELVDRITLQIIDVGGNITWATFPISLDDVEPSKNVLDVNSDGVVNHLDLTPFVSRFGQSGRDPADVNGDGVVDIVDVLLVAGSSSSIPRQAAETFTAADVQKWLTDAKQLGVENTILQKGIVALEYLLAEIMLLSTPIAVAIPDANLHAAIETALGKASGAPLTTADMAMLNHLEANNANITDLTGLEHANNLTALSLDSNVISDISPVSGLTNLTYLNLGSNAISDISPLAELINLTRLELYSNAISNISPLAGLTNLTTLMLQHNAISNISPLAGLTNLTSLRIWNNTISDISALAGLINLTWLQLDSNAISNIPSVAELTNLTNVTLYNNLISDISPLIANTGLREGDTVDVGANPLNFASINTHIPALQSRGVEVFSSNLKNTTAEYILSIPAGISLIHVPLRVTEADGEAKTIESISVLYDVLHEALNGAGTVNFLITYDSQAREWRSYFVPSDKGGPADSRLGDDTGIIVGLSTPVSVHLQGTALGTNGNSAINLGQGLNVVGLPLNNPDLTRVSDLLMLDGIRGNVPVIILTDGGEFKLVGRAGDPGDIEITGGQAFIMTASRAATVAISGDAWANDSVAAAAPPVTLKGVEVGDTTPVLGLRGAIVDEERGLNKPGFRVTVKNLSNGTTVTGSTRDEGIGGYQLTVVDIEAGHAATIGDTLEISAQSRHPFIGVERLQYTITAEDVKRGLIHLPELLAYEIPKETELLANYPNPFNPETWIPYRLAEDALVTLTIYEGNGRVVRSLDVGYQVAAVYERQSKAIYWDGRNEFGEAVASGIYFYHLSAGDYSATRRMVILK